MCIMFNRSSSSSSSNIISIIIIILIIMSSLDVFFAESPAHPCRACRRGDRAYRGHTERPHPQKSDLINFINKNNCSEQAQCCVYLVSCYI